MRRLRIGLNLILLAAPLLFLITGGVRLVRGVFAYLNSNQRLAGTMSAEATHALGREVRVRDVYITGNLWSLDAANRIDLFDVAVANGPVLADGAIATSRRVAVWYNLRQVLANSDVRAPIVDELRLDGPEMLVARSASGHWNYQDLLPKHAEINRPFTSKITVTGGTVQYADNAFPHPPGVAERPLDARISSVHGIVLIRPDKSAAFTISGVAPPAYLRDFTATGTFVPFPLHVQARVLASQVVLPEMARRLAPAAQLSVSRGAADLDVGLVYIPSPNTSPRVFDTRALTAHGTAKIYDASATGKFLYAAVDHLNGAAVFTNDSLQGSGTATYDGMPVQVAGAALGLSFPQRGPQATVPLAPVTVSLHGTVQHVDWPRVRQLGFVPSILARLPQRVRQDMAAATLDGDLAFQIAGPVNSLESTVSGTVHHVAYAGYRGDAVDLRAAIGNGVARASVKGRYAGGDAILRGMVELNDGGRFEASAQGRNLDLARLGIPVGPKLTGTGQLDFAIRGRRNFTPNISTQAEVFDATVNGQEIRHAFARADTVGPDLVIRTLAADDPKGFVTATGTIGMKTRRLNLLVDADDLNFSSIARAFVPKLSAANVSKLSKTPADRALARLAGAQGYGYARTRVTGTIDSPRMDGKVYAFGVQVGDYDLDKVTVSDLSVTKDNLHIDAIASRYPGQVHLAGDILRPFSQTPELMLEGSATDLDLSALTRLAGFDRKDLALTGTLSTTNIPIRGTLSSPQTPDFFTANLQNATINGVPIHDASVTARYQAEGVFIKGASMIVADGLVVGSGWLPFEGPISLQLHAGGIALQPLEEALFVAEKPDQAPPIITGDVNFDAQIGGTVKQPTAVVQSLTSGMLAYNGFQIGTVKASGGYRGSQVRVDRLLLTGPDLPPAANVAQVTAPAGTPAATGPPQAGAASPPEVAADGTVTMRGLTYDLDTKEIRTDPATPIVLDAIRLERVRDLSYLLIENSSDDVRKLLDALRNVSGPVGGTVALRGTTDNPQADITWNAKQIHASGYDLSSVTGSITIDKDRLVYPSPATPDQKFKIDSQYVDILSPADPRIRSVVIEFDKPDRRGLITTITQGGTSGEAVPADISINNVNLQFLQQILDKRIVSQVDGRGDIGITAQGLTTSPSLEFTADFRNVAVHSALDTKLPVTIDRLELLQGSVREGRVSVGSVRAIKVDPQSGASYEASLTADLNGFTYKDPFLPDNATLAVKGGVSVAFLAAAAPSLLRRTSRGDITVSANVASLRKRQSVSGEIDLNVPRLETPSAATGVQDLIARLTLANDVVTVSDFSAHTYVFGRPKDADEPPATIAKPAKPTRAAAKTIAAVTAAPPKAVSPPRVPKAKPVLISENDPARRGSELRVTGSLPLGFRDESATGPNDGLVVRIYDPNENPNGPAAAAPAARGRAKKPAAPKVALTFKESPLPGSKDGVAQGTIRTDTGRPLRITGSAKDPILTGRLTLYNATITPPSEQKPGTLSLPVLPSFDLAVRLGPDVHIKTAQLDAHIATTKDIEAHGRLLQANSDVTMDGDIAITDGRLKFPVTTFTVLPGSSIHVNYPAREAGADVVGMNVDLKARGFVYARSDAGIRRKYTVTVTARGPLTGGNIDPATGRSNLALTFETDPPDLATSQAALTERLAGAIIGVDSLDQLGHNPGQAFASVFTGVLSGSVLPGIFDKTATELGFEELSLGYDPIDRLTLNISRRLFGPFYVSYFRTLTASYERYDLKFSYRFKSRYQLSFDLDEQHTQKLLLEGVWKF